MELLVVIVLGASIGLVIPFIINAKGTYGLLLVPAISAAATAITWVGLLWIGQKFDGTWIWVVSLSAALLAGIVTATALPRRRVEADARLFEQLVSNRA
jgi:hypothetical protein